MSDTACLYVERGPDAEQALQERRGDWGPCHNPNCAPCAPFRCTHGHWPIDCDVCVFSAEATRTVPGPTARVAPSSGKASPADGVQFPASAFVPASAFDAATIETDFETGDHRCSCCHHEPGKCTAAGLHTQTAGYPPASAPEVADGAPTSVGVGGPRTPPDVSGNPACVSGLVVDGPFVTVRTPGGHRHLTEGERELLAGVAS